MSRVASRQRHRRITPARVGTRTLRVPPWAQGGNEGVYAELKRDGLSDADILYKFADWGWDFVTDQQARTGRADPYEIDQLKRYIKELQVLGVRPPITIEEIRKTFGNI